MLRPITATSTFIVRKVHGRMRDAFKRIMKNMRRNLVISEKSVHRIVIEKLKLSSNNMTKRHQLTATNKNTRTVGCWGLLRRTRTGEHLRKLFTDDELLAIEKVKGQYGRILAPKNSSDCPTWYDRRSVQTPSHCFGGNMCNLINQCRFNRARRQDYKNTYWHFQQDSSSAHNAKNTQNWLGNSFPGFDSTLERPLHSLDLNLHTYMNWILRTAWQLIWIWTYWGLPFRECE